MSIWRIIGLIFVFFLATVSWMILGVTMMKRSSDASERLHGSVTELWGNPQAQAAPDFAYVWTSQEEEARVLEENGVQRTVRQLVWKEHEKELSPTSTTINTDFQLDQRLKGLVWYSLYNLKFDGTWTYTHSEPDGRVRLRFRFPDAQGLYDDFRFIVDGADHARQLRPQNGVVSYDVQAKNGQKITLQIAYLTRGLDQWRYLPADGVANIENFKLSMNTDFADIDFPASGMSPLSKTRTGGGWKLDWTFKQMVTGHNIGIVTPQRIQPGELASSMSFSAPISLLFFFLVIFVLGTLRGIDIHPINYLFLAAAFFAFHLLFAYSVDHIQVVPAFTISSIVSVLLVVSYLRLVVSARFAFVEAAAAQLVYLVVFSLAHFWEGYTGLTVTVLSILTLFLLMQLTGRIRWSEVIGRKAMRPAPLSAP